MSSENSGDEAKLKTPPMLYRETQALIEQIEALTGTRLVTYWNSFSGAICHNDVRVLYKLLTQMGRTEQLSIFVKSDGGNGSASLRMVHLLRNFSTSLRAYVPLDCESAATMLVLGADQIDMGPLAFLTPIDTSLRHDLSPVDRDNDLVSVGQNELTRVIKLWNGEAEKVGGGNPYPAIYSYIHPLVIGAVDRASSLSKMLCNEILSYHMEDAERRDRISETLNADYPSHGYPITLKEAQRIGLNVKPIDPELEEMLMSLNDLYSQMGQRCRTDFDEKNHHDNQINNILEISGLQMYYRIDKDWFYRSEERRWVSLNDKGNWNTVQSLGGEIMIEPFHIR
ncbi:hypothetical protein [Nevskia sp.]|uniref:hypothetical protein n=1 Tax=Nevskia sp. TaxID=1929292 RepID=UPI0025E12B76|nr:hypothetical protein [Nevskia sp.]